MASQKRLIASVGNQKCPLGCIYCFVDNIEFTGLPKISLDSTGSLSSQVDLDVDVLQPSADVELFLVHNWLEILEELAKLKKNISFATKSKLTDHQVEFLQKLNEKLNNNGAILNIAVSITSMEPGWREFEKHTPSPEERIETLATLFTHGIPTTVAIRPLLPFLTMEHIDRIVEATHAHTYGYLSGPLYLTDEIKRYLSEHGYYYQSVIKKVSWLPNNPLMETIESPKLEKHLADKANQFGLSVFENNIDAVFAIRKKVLPAILSKPSS